MSPAMSDPAPTLILYPVFAMFLLVAIVLLRMRSMRFAAVRKREVSARYENGTDAAVRADASFGRWREGFSALTSSAAGTGRGGILQRARGEPARAQPHRLGFAEQRPLCLAVVAVDRERGRAPAGR